MKIKLELSPADVVARAQACHRKISPLVAEQALLEFKPTIQRALEDLKTSLLLNVVDYALTGEKLKNGQL